MNDKTPWWSEDSGFFGSWYLDLVSDILTPQQTQHDVNFFISVANLNKGDYVLDIGCADGRHGVELAKRGMRVTCFDISNEMLERVEQRASREKVSVATIQGDMRALHVSMSYKLVLNVFTAFGYFQTNEEHEATLLHMYEVTQEGGTAIVDVVNGTFIRNHLKKEQTFTHPDGSQTIYHRCLSENGTRLLERRERVIGEDIKKEIEMSLRLWDKDELVAMTQACGFKVLHLLGSLNQHDIWTAGAKRLVLVLSKQYRSLT